MSLPSSSAAAAAAPWKQLLLAALDSNAHLKHSRFFQLATVSSNDRPANRTVVFRGFVESCDKIQIHTDSRSNKIQDIKHCPFGEICWYFTDSWEQFRLSGRIDVIGEADTDIVKLQQREKAWFGCSLNSRHQYLAPSPGLPSILEGPNVELNNLDPFTGPVDYLHLKNNERLIFTSKKCEDGSQHWMSQKVYP